MVDVVQYFNGAEQGALGQASTKEEVIALTEKAEWGDGWGYRVRGSETNLEEVGAYKTLYGGWVLPHNDGFIDCAVVFTSQVAA